MAKWVYSEPQEQPTSRWTFTDPDGNPLDPNAVIDAQGQQIPMQNPREPGMIERAGEWANDWRNWGRLGVEGLVTAGMETAAGLPTVATGGTLTPAFLAAQPVIGAAAYEAGNLFDAATGKAPLAPLGDRVEGMAMAGAMQTAVPVAGRLAGVTETAMTQGPRQAVKEIVAEVKSAPKGFLIPETRKMVGVARELDAPVGATDTVAGQMGLGKLWKSKAATKVNEAVNDAVSTLVNGKMGLPNQATRNPLWEQYGSELVEKSGGATVQHQVDPGFREAVAYFLKNPDAIPQSLKGKWGGWLDRVKDQLFWPGATPDSRVFRASLKNTNAAMVLEEVPRADGMFELLVRKGNGKPKSAGVFSNASTMESRLNLAAKALGEKAGGDFERLGSGKLTFEDIRDIYIETRKGANASEFAEMPKAAQQYMAAIRDGSESSLKNVNAAVSDLVENYHKPLASASQAEQQLSKAVANATERIKGPDGVEYTVFNPKKFAATVKKMEGIWTERSTGSSLITPEQRATLKKYVALFEEAAGDLEVAKKMYKTGQPTLFNAIKESGGVYAGSQALGMFTPLPGTSYVLAAGVFNDLMPGLMLSTPVRAVAKGLGEVGKAIAKTGNAAVVRPSLEIGKRAIPAEVPRLDMFGNKEKK